jgi:hypothetical protein
MAPAKKVVDAARVEQIADTAFGYLNGAVTAGMIYLGDELGLYSEIRDAGPLTNEEIASRTGLHERCLRAS